MAFELLDGDDQAERDQRVDQSLGDQCDDHREEAGDDRTDERDERAEKDQRRQRQRQRHAHDRQAGADADRVDERDQERRAHIADQRMEACPAGVANAVPHVRREDLRDERADVAPAVQQEDQREQHQQCARDDLGHGARRRQRPAGQLGLVVAAAPRWPSCRHWSIWSLLRCSGPSVSQSPRRLDAWCSPGRPAPGALR